VGRRLGERRTAHDDENDHHMRKAKRLRVEPPLAGRPRVEAVGSEVDAALGTDEAADEACGSAPPALAAEAAAFAEPLVASGEQGVGSELAHAGGAPTVLRSLHSRGGARRGTIVGTLALAAEAAGALPVPFILAIDRTNEFVARDRAIMVDASACSDDSLRTDHPQLCMPFLFTTPLIEQDAWHDSGRDDHENSYEQVGQAPRGRIVAPADCRVYGWAGHIATAVEANDGGSTDVEPDTQD